MNDREKTMTCSSCGENHRSDELESCKVKKSCMNNLCSYCICPDCEMDYFDLTIYYFDTLLDIVVEQGRFKNRKQARNFLLNHQTKNVQIRTVFRNRPIWTIPGTFAKWTTWKDLPEPVSDRTLF